MKRPTAKYLNNVPKTDDTFLARILKTLNMSATELAATLRVPVADIELFLRPRYELVEIDRDELWWKISELVDQRIGLLMAARHELQKALQSDRARRALRTERFLQRDKKPPLR